MIKFPQWSVKDSFFLSFNLKVCKLDQSKITVSVNPPPFLLLWSKLPPTFEYKRKNNGQFKITIYFKVSFYSCSCGWDLSELNVSLSGHGNIEGRRGIPTTWILTDSPLFTMFNSTVLFHFSKVTWSISIFLQEPLPPSRRKEKGKIKGKRKEEQVIMWTFVVAFHT